MTANAALADSEIRWRFLAVDTSNAADVLDGLGLIHQGLASTFGAVVPITTKIAGWAFPIQGHHERTSPTGGDARKMAACDAVGPDSVTVWAGAGEGVCFFGELIALRLKERGCVGSVADGGVRDISWLAEHDFPVFARYRTPIQSIGRWQVDEFNVPVELPGATSSTVRVEPGDFILADADGVLVIPASLVTQVLKESEQLGRREREVRAAIGSGMSLDHALTTYGHV